MALTVVGSIAFDCVRTPFGERERMLGGSAVHFALAASFFTEVRVVGPVGDDFGAEHLAALAARGIETADIEHVAGGETFFWRGHYEHDMNVAHTDETRLNVFADFEPKLSPAPRAPREMLFLGNIQPELQRDVRGQSEATLRGARLDEPVDRHRARRRWSQRSPRSTACCSTTPSCGCSPSEPNLVQAARDAMRARARGRGRQARRVRAAAVQPTTARSRSRGCRSRRSATRPAPATASPAASSATSTRSGSDGAHD